MSDLYIRPARAHLKLKQAYQRTRPVYICGVSGFGKTSLVRNFLIKKKYHYLSCQNDEWDISELLLAKDSNSLVTVVIDDMQNLVNPQCQADVIQLLNKENIWPVLICRSKLPSWLMECYFKRSFTIIDENDLGLEPKEINMLFEEAELNIPDEKWNDIYLHTRGNPFVLRCAKDSISKDDNIDMIIERAGNIYTKHIIENVLPYFDSDVLDFLVKVSIADTFDVPMANMITGRSDAEKMISRCEETGNFIIADNNIFHIRSEWLVILNEYKKKEYDLKLLTDCYYNAGIYYSINGHDEKAIEMFSKSGNTDKVKEILVRNSAKNPGTGYYYEMRTYYAALDPIDIENDVGLMAGMSMLYSLMMDAKKSEYWYNRLNEKKQEYRGAKRREATIKLAYLDITLPHRGSNNILNIIYNSAKMSLKAGGKFPKMSLTSNMPSVMNGGKDFCSWSKQDDYIAGKFGSVIAGFLGDYGKCIVNEALAESYFEKAKNPSIILQRLSHIIIDAKTDDLADMEFAVQAIKSRLYLSCHDYKSAVSCISGFEKKAEEQSLNKILENVQAFRCRLAMYAGDNDRIDRWLESAPDEDNNFFIMDRYKYMIKIRCYILKKKYICAYSLIEKMKYYAENYDRKYISMELGILSSILNYRSSVSWKKEFSETLLEISSYDFVRIISEEGAAVLPLLKAYYKDDCSKGGSPYAEWLSRVLTETEKMAASYPLYLKEQKNNIPIISGKAKSILYLQSQGYSLSKIAQELDMKESTVKYHIKENYRKLDVKNKIDAVLTAKHLRII